MKKEVVGDHDQRSGSAVGIGDQRAEIAEPKHTPTPWEARGLIIRTKQGIVATCPTPQNGGTFDCSANAEFIVRAVNSHADMLAALKGLIDRLDFVHAHPAFQSVWTLHQLHGGAYSGPTYNEELETARAAIARAEGR